MVFMLRRNLICYLFIVTNWASTLVCYLLQLLLLTAERDSVQSCVLETSLQI
jgi:hypothetical protein